MSQAQSHKYDALFQPFQVGKLTIPTRLVLCAMGGTALISDGKFNETGKQFFLRCAKGGAGLVIPGLSILADKWGRPGWLDEDKDAFHGPLKDFMAQFHEETDSKLVMQLGAGMGRGLRANCGLPLPYFNYERAMIAPSELPNVFKPELKHRAMTKDEIHKLVDVMINSAVLAKEAGCDGVEIHAIHEGYLLDQFAIANYNHRTDEYGGSLDNRLRISIEMVRGIKEACGEDFPVLMRYSVASKTAGFNQSVLPGEDYTEWGRSLEESLSVVRRLEAAGVDALDTDNGTYDSWHWCHPPTYMPDVCNLPESAYIRNFCKIPVMVSGKMGNPDVALQAVVSGAVDAVAMARPFLADNDWAAKVREGRVEDIRPCIGCHNGCFGRLTNGKNVSCALNPECLQEGKYFIQPAERKKNVLVVGGGIGGMEAARLCALRGLPVELYEKTGGLGGAFVPAASMDFKEDDRKLLKWYEKQLRDLNIPVHLNTEVTEELLREKRPDVVIVASGAVNKTLPIPGTDGANVMDAKDNLVGDQRPCKHTVVIGGGLTGCEVAYSIAKQGGQVSVVEAQEDIMNVLGLCKVNSDMLRDLLKFHQVKVYTGAAARAIRPDGVDITVDGKEVALPAEQVILSIGYKPAPLEAALPEAETYFVGDCTTVGNLLHVIWGAYETVQKL